MAPVPNGCRHCGRDRRDHGIEWYEAAGFHHWTEPTDSQRIERMRAARTDAQ